MIQPFRFGMAMLQFILVLSVTLWTAFLPLMAINVTFESEKSVPTWSLGLLGLLLGSIGGFCVTFTMPHLKFVVSWLIWCSVFAISIVIFVLIFMTFSVIQEGLLLGSLPREAYVYRAAMLAGGAFGGSFLSSMIFGTTTFIIRSKWKATQFQRLRTRLLENPRP